jgi:hypothetical protein
MERNGFLFKVDCPTEKVTAEMFGLASDAFVQILAKANAKNWRISEVRLASVNLVASPLVLDSKAEESFEMLDRLMAIPAKALLSKPEIEEFSSIINKMSALANASGSDVIMSVGLKESRFTSAVLNQAELTLRKAAKRTFGHVVGRIDKLILQPQRGNRSIGLINQSTGQRVNIAFGAELDSTVTTLNPGRVVEAAGFLRVNDDKSLHLDAESIECIEEHPRVPVTADDLEGLLGTPLPHDITSVDIIRNLRAEQGNPRT